jgi:hypothetical protein
MSIRIPNLDTSNKTEVKAPSEVLIGRRQGTSHAGLLREGHLDVQSRQTGE